VKEKTSLVLGIETSCDETAAAVVAGGRAALASVVASQDEFHARFGGIVPEIASRRHVEVVEAVIQEALDRAGIRFADTTAVAVTVGPGLIGSLVVGVAAAKALAAALCKPLVGVNHLEGHIYSNFLAPELGAAFEPPGFPHLALVASGGHCHLVRVTGHGRYEVLGRRRDDAPGEAFEKGARLLGLGYPGGAALADLADSGNPHAVEFPVARIPGSWDFSFSGVKTALARRVAHEQTLPETARTRRADLAAGYQEAIVQALVQRIEAAADTLGISLVSVSGGVARNRRLRQALGEWAHRSGLEIRVPPPEICTDNAAMIACAGYFKLVTARPDALDLDCAANLELESWGGGSAPG